MAIPRALRLYEETSYGVAAGSPSYYAIAGESLKRKPSLSSIQPERRISPNRQTENRRSTGGGVDVYCGWQGVGKWLKYVFGAPVTSAAAGGLYAHVFSPNPQAAPPSLSLDPQRDIYTHRYQGSFATALRFAAALQDKHFGLSIQTLGQEESSLALDSAATDADFEISIAIGEQDSGAATPFQLTLSDGSTTWQAFTEAVEVNLSFNRRLRFAHSRPYPTGMLGGSMATAGLKSKWYFDSDSAFLLDAFRNRTDLTASLSLYGAAYFPTFQTLLWEFPLLRINADPPTMRSSGYLNLDFPQDYGAFYSTSAGYGPVRATLTNEVASYA